MGCKRRSEHRSNCTLNRLWFGLAFFLGVLGGCNQSDESRAPPVGAQPAAQAHPNVAQPSAKTPHPPHAQPTLPQSSNPPLNSVESLVAPVALYPDPLLSELLIASTYPVEIVQAARWLETNPDLATLKDQDWDPSVQRIAQVPVVLKMMNEHLDWTTSLGNAFLENPDALLAAIQVLRVTAVDSGFLKDTPEQKVDKKTVTVGARASATVTPVESRVPAEQPTPSAITQEIVTIQPAKEDTLYVPRYRPEAVYSAPLAAPSGTTGDDPVSARPAYYPTYAPTAPTTDTSTTNPWLTFGAGALVGGLVTWGIMELADDDDWDNGYWGGGFYGGPVRVVHHYGDAVCYRGNCWNGGGYRSGGYRGDVSIDRGDIHLNREVNVVGNRIVGDRTFKFDDLTRTDQVWRHDPQHRRGQRYTESAKERIAESQQPGRAGSRLSGLEGLRDGDRGFGGRALQDGSGRPGAPLPKRPPSSDEVRTTLSGKRLEGSPATPRGKLRQGSSDGGFGGARQKPGDGVGKAANKLAGARQEGALRGAGERGSQIRQEAQRGKASRNATGGNGGIRERAPANGGRGERPRQRAQERSGVLAEQRKTAQQLDRQQRAPGSPPARQQRIDQIRRDNSPSPNAFGGARDGGRARDFAQRGASSREKLQTHRASFSDRGGGFGHGGGGKGRGDGGGRRRGR